jgi:UDP-N-acetylmuramate--alanine ligase
LRFGLPGKHNLMNALMAIAMAQIFGTNRAIALALASFKELKRFSYQIKKRSLVYIDDYASSTEIDAVYQAVTIVSQ